MRIQRDKEPGYAALRRTVTNAGLFEPAYGYYALVAALSLVLLTAALVVSLLAPAFRGRAPLV